MDKQQFPLVSVITTVYNTEKYVEECLDSVLNQIYKNVELIVVDNASEGTISDIVKSYKVAYPEKTIKFVQLEKNAGLYHGRLAGAKVATGDYISFIDSDDTISVDFYYKLINEAIKQDADIIAAEFADRNSQNTTYSGLDNLRIADYNLRGEEVFKHYMLAHGTNFGWFAIWNKLYRRDLWEKCAPFFEQIKEKLVLAEDIVYSTILFSNAQHFVNIHGACYYHRIHSTAFSAVSSVKRAEANVQDLVNAFAQLEIYLKKVGLYREYSDDFIKYKQLHAKFWKGNIFGSDIPKSDKERCIKRIEREFSLDKDEWAQEKDCFFYSIQSELSPNLEHCYHLIKDSEVEIISFDIFDTLIVRPVFEPQDIFLMLNRYFNQINPNSNFSDFSILRIQGELRAREIMRVKSPSYEDVTLDEIYESIGNTFLISESILENMKQKELELEFALCKPRKFAQELYNLAIYLGKRVICISDMYLSEKNIKSLLIKNGYGDVEKIFMSSEYRQTKGTGTLYKEVIRTLDIKPEKILHIGDNHLSDIIRAEKIGMKTIHLTKNVDMLQNQNPGIYAGESFNAMMVSEGNNSFSALSFMGFRYALATVANKLYDNPFVSINRGTDYNANPYIIGYYPLGMYMVGVCKWLIEQIKDKQYKTVHFIARDGYLLKVAYDILSKNTDVHLPKSNYLRVSRKSLMPLIISCRDDVYSLEFAINIFSNSPQKLLKLLKPIIQEERYVNAKTIFEKQGLLYEKQFLTRNEYDQFLKIFLKDFYDDVTIQQYRRQMKKYFSGIIGENDCTFDIGYSGRTEMILSKLLGKRIDAFYIHTHTQLANNNASKGNFQVKTFMEQTPRIAGTVRELFLSELGPSCIGYEISEEGGQPIFDENDIDYAEMFVLTQLQRGALDFIKDMADIYREWENIMVIRPYDMTMPFEYFLNRGKALDRSIFKCIEFEDDLFLGERVNTTDFWSNQMQMVNISQDITVYPTVPKWKKAIYYALFDRKMLKEKVKSRYAKHPILLGFLKVVYSIPRAIYHLIKQ